MNTAQKPLQPNPLKFYCIRVKENYLHIKTAQTG
jgi:hypothetical protein